MGSFFSRYPATCVWSPRDLTLSSSTTFLADNLKAVERSLINKLEDSGLFLGIRQSAQILKSGPTLTQWYWAGSPEVSSSQVVISYIYPTFYLLSKKLRCCAMQSHQLVHDAWSVWSATVFGGKKVCYCEILRIFIFQLTYFIDILLPALPLGQWILTHSLNASRISFRRFKFGNMLIQEPDVLSIDITWFRVVSQL